MSLIAGWLRGQREAPGFGGAPLRTATHPAQGDDDDQASRSGTWWYGSAGLMAFFEVLSPCLIGMEACASAHHWARELTKIGHEVRLMPAKDVKAYVKRNKNDAADAEAICEAVRR